MIKISTTKNKILNASILVFAEKGYESSTTLEISKRAELSEMTLFRHFKTKENLFNEAIRKTIGESVLNDSDTNYNLNIADFIHEILKRKLTMMSSNKDVIRMLIRESLSNRLNNDLNFPLIIYNETMNKLKKFKKMNDLNFNEKVLTDYIVGFLLKQIVIGNNFNYLDMTIEDQFDSINKYVRILQL